MFSTPAGPPAWSSFYTTVLWRINEHWVTQQGQMFGLVCSTTEDGSPREGTRLNSTSATWLAFSHWIVHWWWMLWWAQRLFLLFIISLSSFRTLSQKMLLQSVVTLATVSKTGEVQHPREISALLEHSARPIRLEHRNGISVRMRNKTH